MQVTTYRGRNSFEANYYNRIPRLPVLQSEKSIRTKFKKINDISKNDEILKNSITNRETDRYSQYQSSLGLSEKTLNILQNIHSNRYGSINSCLSSDIRKTIVENNFQNLTERFMKSECESNDHEISKLLKISLKRSKNTEKQNFSFESSNANQGQIALRNNDTLEFDVNSLNLLEFREERYPKIESLIYDPTNLSHYEKNQKLLKNFFKYNKKEAKDIFLHLLSSGMEKELLNVIYKGLFADNLNVEDNESFKKVFGDLTQHTEWRVFKAHQKANEREVLQREKQLEKFVDPFKKTEPARKIAKRKNNKLYKYSRKVKTEITEFVHQTKLARKGKMLKRAKSERSFSQSRKSSSLRSARNKSPGQKRVSFSNTKNRKSVFSIYKSSKQSSPVIHRRITPVIEEEESEFRMKTGSLQKRIQKKKKKKKKVNLKPITKDNKLIKKNMKIAKEYAVYKKTKRREFMALEQSRSKRAKDLKKKIIDDWKQEVVEKMEERARKLEKKRRTMVLKRTLKKEIKIMKIIITVINYLWELKRFVSYSKEF